MGRDVKCKGAKVKAFLCSENGVYARESERMNVDVLSAIQRSLWYDLVCIHLSLYAQKSTWHPYWHFISLTCLFGFFTGNSHRQLIVSCIFPPSPLFRFAMECLMWGVKKSCRVKHCGRAALWYAPSPNLILAVLKIVCVSSWTDRPLFPESLCCSRRWKRPLCASSAAQRPHEIFTGQHLVWDGERGAGESTILPPITARPQLY